MGVNINYTKLSLKFNFPARTSRGAMTHRDSWLVVLSNNFTEVVGVGEVAPLPGLSREDMNAIPGMLSYTRNVVMSKGLPGSFEEIPGWLDQCINPHWSSIRFGIETALRDYLNGGNREVLSPEFVAGQASIPINGLIWMGEEAFMKSQMEKKTQEGYACIKIKVGALDFEKEMQLLKWFRKHYPAGQFTLRLDANGAFGDDALGKLQQLSAVDIHSIEQPIFPGRPDIMAQIVKDSPIPIALDEELIGVTHWDEKVRLLEVISPHYIILKPSLHGGIVGCLEWIEIARGLDIGFWITSALESNVGLNAICQLAASQMVTLPQGLGTGQLYNNNIPSPLSIEKGHIFYNNHLNWDFDSLLS